MDFLQFFFYGVFELPLPRNAQKRTKKRSQEKKSRRGGWVGLGFSKSTGGSVDFFWAAPRGGRATGAPQSKSKPDKRRDGVSVSDARRTGRRQLQLTRLSMGSIANSEWPKKSQFHSAKCICFVHDRYPSVCQCCYLPLMTVRLRSAAPLL
jgi:hypothetical protein